MHMISYVSDVMVGPQIIKNEMANIVDVAQTRNKKFDVTGVLFYENNHFFQIIEGEEAKLRDVYRSIEKDKRHAHVTKLIDQPVVDRTFSDWSMESFYVDNPSFINPETLMLLRELYVHNFGVNAAGLVNFVKKMIDEMDTFKIIKGLEE